MNKSKYINPKNCFSCGECCKYFELCYPKTLEKTDKVLFSEVSRFRELNTNKITIRETKDYFYVRFNYRCMWLIEKNNKFYCKIYNKNRPELCKQYPFKETESCPYKEVL